MQRVWREALSQGVIAPTLEAEIPAATAAYAELSAQQLLSTPAPLAVSPLTDLLGLAGLGQEQQHRFAELYVEYRTDLPKFWGIVAKNFGDDVSRRLQVNGKIAQLTLNNAPLIEQLHRIGGNGGLSDPVQLAAVGLHRAAQWRQLIGPETPIPDTIPGETPEERRANYADFLAAQIRLSYPTAAVAHMVQVGELKVDSPLEVHAFLTEHQGQFEIGVQPVEQYIARRNLEVPAETVLGIKRLQRTYQITASDQAMSALLARDVDSAYQVVQYGKDAFIRDFATELGDAEQARQTYDKAAHVHNTVLNVAISYLTARTGLALGALPLASDGDRRVRSRTGQIVQPAPARRAGSDVIAYPTLEGLFGSMDFCACDHCRSILSPAAYLVDLLNFIDQTAPPAGTDNPQTVLLERRPDLEHLPLTCENTNTAMPYIDVVNETLEYFIANETAPFSLTGYTGHDTGDALSEDLLASPQFVMDAAYSTLLGQRFPAPLPFHKSLEELRRYFDKFEVPLTLAMERFRVKDTLERAGAPYGWRDILMEEARLSRAEYRIFTDSSAVPLWRMYGFPNGTARCRRDCRALQREGIRASDGVSRYEDLVRLLKTRFVNPDTNLIPKAEKLRCILRRTVRVEKRHHHAGRVRCAPAHWRWRTRSC